VGEQLHQHLLGDILARVGASAEIVEGGTSEGSVRRLAGQEGLPGGLVDEALEELGDELG
jgi:hypothetical protein